MAHTLYDKLWQAHVIHQEQDSSLIYIDRHLLHEVTSPQAFEQIVTHQRPVWRTRANIAVVDHNVPTHDRHLGISDPISAQQIATLAENCQQHDIHHIGMDDIRQGIVHVMAPEQGAVLPGMTVVCGDSHTSTHGAFAALAFGIGTSEVEHVLATQTLVLKKAKNMRIHLIGNLPAHCTAKDIILYIIRSIGTAGGTGYAIEFSGAAIEALSIEGRMSICNMAIEAGARSGMIAVDQTTIDYFKGRPYAPQGDAWDAAVAYWRNLHSEQDAHFDQVIELDISQLSPQVSWGTSPEMVAGVNETIPQNLDDTQHKALAYMGLQAGQNIQDILLDKIFIGSCTNSRLEDLQLAAQVVQKMGGKIAPNITLAMVVPGSGLVKQQAQALGLDKIFINAGFEWREPGCSMCLAMNADKLLPQERCASTSNRNFEGRQGNGGRTHLVSPAMAAAAAMAGHFVDIRENI